MLIGLVDECPTAAPQPVHNDAKHEQRHGQPHDLVLPWGQGDLGLERQSSSHQKKGNPGCPPSWTLTCESHCIRSYTRCSATRIMSMSLIPMNGTMMPPRP